jgi:hypothetical protein
MHAARTYQPSKPSLMTSLQASVRFLVRPQLLTRIGFLPR